MTSRRLVAHVSAGDPDDMGGIEPVCKLGTSTNCSGSHRRVFGVLEQRFGEDYFDYQFEEDLLRFSAEDF